MRSSGRAADNRGVSTPEAVVTQRGAPRARHTEDALDALCALERIERDWRLAEARGEALEAWRVVNRLLVEAWAPALDAKVQKSIEVALMCWRTRRRVPPDELAQLVDAVRDNLGLPGAER